jgi:hypothetical protein
MRAGAKLELRFHEGRFYRQSADSVFDPGRSGLESEMGTAICDHVLAERQSTASIGPTDDTGGWKSILWTLHDRSRLSQFMKGFHQSVPDSVWTLAKPFDPVKHDGDLLPQWAEIASNYVSSLIVVDGRLWLPVDEPMLATRGDEVHFDDASCYRARVNLPHRLPPPFGTDSGGLGEVGVCHTYWDPRWNYMTLPEAVANANRETGWVGDVLMPEAFTIDHAALQLDRAARVSAASINWITDNRSIQAVQLIGNEWHRFQSAFKRLLRTEAQKSSDAIEHLLGEFTGYLASNEMIDPDVERFVKRTNIQEMIEKARDRWNDRPVDLGNEFSGTSNFSMPMK